MLKEFRDFAVKGNVMDLAVAVIIGGAFGKIVSSLVEDIVMPPIGLLLGKVDLANLFINLTDKHAATLADAKKAGIPVLAYGQFLNQCVNFIILAFVVFMMVRTLNRLRKSEPAAPPAPPAPSAEEALLAEIRDLLKGRGQ